MTGDASKNGENSEDILHENIKIFSNDEEKLKALGKMLNSDLGRKILQLLIQKEMTANEIATEMKLSLPLTLHHINQMIECEIAVICKTVNNDKNQPMKYYTAKSGIVILPEKAAKKAKNSKSLSKSLREIMKFAAIGIASVASYVLTQPPPTDELVFASSDEINLTWPLLIIVIGLISERVFSKIKKRREFRINRK